MTLMDPHGPSWDPHQHVPAGSRHNQNSNPNPMATIPASPFNPPAASPSNSPVPWPESIKAVDSITFTKPTEPTVAVSPLALGSPAAPAHVDPLWVRPSKSHMLGFPGRLPTKAERKAGQREIRMLEAAHAKRAAELANTTYEIEVPALPHNPIPLPMRTLPMRSMLGRNLEDFKDTLDSKSRAYLAGLPKPVQKKRKVSFQSPLPTMPEPKTDKQTEVDAALRSYLQSLMLKSIQTAEKRGAKTVTPADVAEAKLSTFGY